MTRTIVGHIRAILIQVERIADAGEGLFDIMDADSSDLAEYHGALFKPKDCDYKDGVRRKFIDILTRDLLIIDRVAIEPEFRGRGLGLLAVCRLIDVFGENCGLVAIKPFPLQFSGQLEPNWQSAAGVDDSAEAFNAAMAKVRNHWARAGFKRVKGTDYYALCPAAVRPTLKNLVALFGNSGSEPLRRQRDDQFAPPQQCRGETAP